MSGFPSLSSAVRVVSWDADRVAVRSGDGVLLWYEDSASMAFRDDEDPLGGDIRVVPKAESTTYPRRLRATRREWDAVAVRSVADLMEVVDLGHLTIETQDSPIVLRFPGADASSTVRLSDDSRLVLHADGLVGTMEWRIELTGEDLTQGDEVLRAVDL